MIVPARFRQHRRAEFPDAETVDFDREGNRHLAFGGGIHRCLGSHLARLELRVALEELHRRIPDYEIAPARPPTVHAEDCAASNICRSCSPRRRCAA